MDKIDDGPAYDPEPARLYRQVVAQERADREEAGRVAGRALAGVQPAAPAKLAAVCSKGGGRINQHFGHAQEFLVFEVDGAGVRFVGHRKAGAYCRGGYGDDDRMKTILTALNGIDAVFVAKIGRCPKDELAKAGIEAIDGHAFAYIETAVATWYADRFAAAATPARAARHA